MLLTPHVTVGLVIARIVPNPLLAVMLSLLSHFLGDLMPHWDFFSKTKKEERLKGWRPIAIMADFGLGIAMGMFFTLNALWVKGSPQLAVTSFLCGIFAVTPDVLEAPYLFMNKTPFGLERLLALQRKMQVQAPFLIGISTQLAVIATSLLFLTSN